MECAEPINQLMRAAFEAAPNGVVITDDAGAILLVNARVERDFGYSRAELIGQSVDTLLPERFRASHGEQRTQFLTEGGTQLLVAGRNIMARRKDGAEFPVEINLNTVTTDGGAVVIASIVDISARLAERSRAEATLRESEDRYRSLVEQAVDGIFLADSTGRYLDANSAGAKMLGYTLDELRQLTLTDVIVPEALPRAPGQFANLDTGAVVRNEWRFRRKDGSIFVGELVGRRLPDGRLLGILRDITEREQVETALRASKRRFRAIFNHQFQYTALLTPEERIVEISDSIAEGTGVTSADVIGKPFLDGPWWRDLPEMRARWRRQIDEALAQPGPSRGEAVYRVKDGSTRHALNTVTALRDGRGEVEYLLVEGIDITERMQAEEKLRESQQDFARAQEVGQIGWWRLDTTKNVLTWSDENHRIFGVPKGTPLTYESFLNTVHPDDRDFVHARWMAGLAGEPYDIEHRIVVDGTVKWVREKAYLEFGEDGALIGGFGVTQDITERKQAEDALREAGRRKDEFLAMLAHELRNPLAPIRNMAAVLRWAPIDDPKVRMASEVIERQTGQLTRLVDELLDISRITRGAFTIAKDPCDLTDVVRGAVEDQRAQMEKRGLRLDLRAPNQPLPLRGDRHRLAQALQNLLHNAQKFTPEGGEVLVTLSVEAGRAEIAVKDNGVGVPQDLLPDIFEPFHQGPQALNRPAGGLGLGLALVKGVAQLHGGEATAANNADGPGATFTLRLPLDPAAALPTAKPPATAAHSRRVLLVEDDPFVAESTCMLLEILGQDVKVVSTGAQALEVARVFHPEIVFCDIGLPAPMDGFAVARAFRQDPALASTYLVALSGYGHQEAIEKGRAAGFDLHLMKPVGDECLQQLLSKAPTA